MGPGPQGDLRPGPGGSQAIEAEFFLGGKGGGQNFIVENRCYEGLALCGLLGVNCVKNCLL